MSGWDCVYHVGDRCEKVTGKGCDPGMKGCVLAGRFRFSNTSKNRPAGLRPPSRPPIEVEERDDAVQTPETGTSSP